MCECVSTCDVEDGVVSCEGAVLPALAFPVDHDLHDLCPQGDVAGVDGHPGGGAVTGLVVLACDKQRQAERKAVHFVTACARVKVRNPAHAHPLCATRRHSSCVSSRCSEGRASRQGTHCISFCLHTFQSRSRPTRKSSCTRSLNAPGHWLLRREEDEAKGCVIKKKKRPSLKLH